MHVLTHSQVAIGHNTEIPSASQQRKPIYRRTTKISDLQSDPRTKPCSIMCKSLARHQYQRAQKWRRNGTETGKQCQAHNESEATGEAANAPRHRRATAVTPEIYAQMLHFRSQIAPPPALQPARSSHNQALMCDGLQCLPALKI